MEFRCENCEHVGVPSAVKPGEGKVLLVCANCGHENTLGVDEATPAARPEAPEFDRERAIQLLNAGTKPVDSMEGFHDEAMKRLIPVPGPGPRCPKCVHLLDASDEFCGRCGLNVDEGRRFSPGQAPWEVPPAGSEDTWEQADLLWRALDDDWSDDNFDKFANFVRDEKLTEFAARKMRWRLVDEPEDERAREFLREIAEILQSRIMVARAQAQANVEQFSDVTQRARNAILWSTLILWLIILTILVVSYVF